VAFSALQKNIQLVTELPPDLPPKVFGDDGRLRQVLLNLLGNAIKFTPQGTVTLAVKAKTQDGAAKLHVCVRDTGIGIPQDQINKIFDAFAQVDTSSTRQFGGTGLGLAICTQLVQAMGGRLWAESEIGKGSAFYFDLQVGVVPQINGAEWALLPSLQEVC
jgi:signal transduction histidine kinase